MLSQAITPNNNNTIESGENICLSEKPISSGNKDELTVSNQCGARTSPKHLSDNPIGKADSCALTSDSFLSNDAFSTCAASPLVSHYQTSSPKNDPDLPLSNPDTNDLSFDVSGLASATVSCEMVSPTPGAKDAASTPISTYLLNSISLADTCSNPESSAMSDEASSLASFFETNSESFKISGDDEKTPQSVSPMPSDQCWDTGGANSFIINTANNQRHHADSYCSRDTLSPTEKIGIEFDVARINGDSLCNSNIVDCVSHVPHHTTKSEHLAKDPMTSDSLESLSSNTSEGNVCNKVSLPKLAARQPVSPSQAYLNKHCAINGMKLGLYKPSLLKAVNKKQKPSLQRMFNKT